MKNEEKYKNIIINHFYMFLIAIETTPNICLPVLPPTIIPFLTKS
jgi:hypothetical protein